MPTSSSPTVSVSHSSGGVETFMNGVTVGVLLGVAGYYLFGTKQGTVVRKKLVEEWQHAEQAVETAVSDPNASERWHNVFSRLAQELGFSRHRHAFAASKTTRQTAFVKKMRSNKKSQHKFIGT